MQYNLQDRYGRMIYYTSKARKENIKPETIEYIKQANQLDLRLHTLVHELFDKRYKDLSAAGKITPLPESKTKWDRDARLTEDTVHPFVLPPPGWQVPPQLRPYEPPPPPPEKAHVTFISENAADSTIFWVSPDTGAEMQMLALGKNSVAALNSMTTHKFRVRDTKTNEKVGDDLVVPHKPGGSVKFFLGDNPRTLRAVDEKTEEAPKPAPAKKSKKHDEL